MPQPLVALSDMITSHNSSISLHCRHIGSLAFLSGVQGAAGPAPRQGNIGTPGSFHQRPGGAGGHHLCSLAVSKMFMQLFCVSVYLSWHFSNSTWFPITAAEQHSMTVVCHSCQAMNKYAASAKQESVGFGVFTFPAELLVTGWQGS